MRPAADHDRDLPTYDAAEADSATSRALTLLTAARDPGISQAAVLADLLRG